MSCFFAIYLHTTFYMLLSVLHIQNILQLFQMNHKDNASSNTRKSTNPRYLRKEFIKECYDYM